MSVAADKTMTVGAVEEAGFWHGPAIAGFDHHFADPAVEHAFMHDMRHENRRRLILCIVSAAVIACVNIVTDIGTYLLHPALLLRYAIPQIASVGGAAALFLFARRAVNATAIERLAIIFAVAWTASRLFAILSPDKAVYSGSAMIIGSVALLYFGLPISFSTQVPLMAALSIAMLATFEIAKPDHAPALISAVMWLGVLHMIGISALRAMRRTLRRGYAQGIALRHLALHDPLTGLPNRRNFEQTLDREFRRATQDGSPLSIITLDIDHFKQFNDKAGHLAGDICLQKIANVLAGCLNHPGDLAARVGGEEFAFVLPDTDHDGARRIADTIATCIRSAGLAHPASPISKTVTACFGVATTTQSAAPDSDAFLLLADHLLYCAKHHGRNRIAASAFGDEKIDIYVP